MIHIEKWTLDCRWRITFDSHLPGLADTPFNETYGVGVIIERMNGNEWEEEIGGQIKRNGCCDWGFNDRIMIHYCGQKDTTLFALTFLMAMHLMEEPIKMDV